MTQQIKFQFSFHYLSRKDPGTLCLQIGLMTDLIFMTQKDKQFEMTSGGTFDKRRVVPNLDFLVLQVVVPILNPCCEVTDLFRFDLRTAEVGSSSELILGQLNTGDVH